MKRLLWKEWHELRWYLIAIVFGPLVVSFWLSEGHIDRGTNPGPYVLNTFGIQMLMFILLFWGAGRMRDEVQSNLPIGRFQMLAVKLLPGLIIAGLFPYWIRFTIIANGMWVDNSPLAWLAYSVALYMVSFAFSLFASSIASVLAAWLTVFIGGITLGQLIHYVIHEDFIHLLMAVAAFFTIIGICLVVRNADARRKAAVILISMMLAFPTGLIIKNGARVDGIRSDLINTFAHPKEPDKPFDGSYAHNVVRILASPDRRMFAYAVNYGTVDEVKIRDIHGTRTIAERNCTAPIAWLPNGNLLIIASDTALDTQLLEWNHKSGMLSYLVRFSDNHKNRWFDMPSIRRAIPSPDGTKIALFVESEKDYNRNLWILDRKSRKLKLAHPGMGWYGDKSQDVSWDGDRLIFIKRNHFWSVRSDGSDFKRIF